MSESLYADIDHTPDYQTPAFMISKSDGQDGEYDYIDEPQLVHLQQEQIYTKLGSNEIKGAVEKQSGQQGETAHKPFLTCSISRLACFILIGILVTVLIVAVTASVMYIVFLKPGKLYIYIEYLNVVEILY